LLEEIAAAWGSADFETKFRKLYPQCQGISIDYAVLEPRSAKGPQASNLFCLRAGLPIFFVCAPTSAGTIWGPGRRCTITRAGRRPQCD
jgi:hypothetical protein